MGSCFYMAQTLESLDGVRHSLAHLLAAAVRELWPSAQNAIGPAIKDGFYQDFGGLTQQLSSDDLSKIEDKMHEILKKWGEFKGQEVTPDEARKEFAWNPYKLELIEEFVKKGLPITFYTCGGFVDLCKGGHTKDARSINPDGFKLTKIAGAYWRGDEKAQMLTRIYGVAFPSVQELTAYLQMIEEAEKRDHRKLGKELDLFVFSDLVGSGLALWTPRGTLLRTLLDEYIWQLRKERGYEQVTIPHITKKDLYEISGHWDKFKDDLFKITTREGHEFAMKPMNCPHHTQIYSRTQHSYRELPQRYAETTMVYRDEQSGELAGLSRVRCITQDDAHVFCRESQMKEEMFAVWDIINAFYKSVGFGELSVRLSLHDPLHMEKYLGSKDVWEKTEQQLRELVSERGVSATEAIGEAAMYGPKIDFIAKDALGREWQVATIQIDRNQPERFDLSCINESGEKERIVMIHAAIMGSTERFLSVLIEHCAGAFPLWLTPVQVAVLPVGENFAQNAHAMASELSAHGIRAEVDDSNDTVGKKVRSAAKTKVPYIVVIGEKEASSDVLTVRVRGHENQISMSKDAFLAYLQGKIQKKSLELE